jgi:hypothetical protein
LTVLEPVLVTVEPPSTAKLSAVPSPGPVAALATEPAIKKTDRTISVKTVTVTAEANGDDGVLREATSLDERLDANSPLGDGRDDAEKAADGGSAGLTAARS